MVEGVSIDSEKGGIEDAQKRAKLYVASNRPLLGCFSQAAGGALVGVQEYQPVFSLCHLVVSFWALLD